MARKRAELPRALTLFTLLAAAAATAPPLVAAAAAAAAPPTLYLFDLRSSRSSDAQTAYETAHLVAAIQGIVNRDGPVLYVLYVDGADEAWLSYMQTSWISNTSITHIATLEALVTQFAGAAAGVVLYDITVPATSNVASTAAGVQSLLPFAYRPAAGTLYTQFVASGLVKPVVLTLVGKFNGSETGSAKCDAYMWAIREYIHTGLCSNSIMGYFVDYWAALHSSPGVDTTTFTVTNHDWFIAHKAFFFDLDSWGDEAPNDEPQQPLGTDLATMQAMLQAMYDANGGTVMSMIGGFTPWAFKYCNGKHGGVATEWQCAMVTTSYNTYVSADACCVGAMANAAVFQHFPLAERYSQNARPQPQDLAAQGFYDPATGTVADYNYYAYYVGDYDSEAWLYSEFYKMWNDTARGSVPLGWAVNPSSTRRFPPAFAMMFETLTAADVLTTGDSGAGYVNPTQLFPPRKFSQLPSGAAVWAEWCTSQYSRFDMTFTGFLINGAAGGMSAEAQNLYVPFSWDGMTDQSGYAPSSTVPFLTSGTTPVFQEQDLPGGDVKGATAAVLANFKPGRSFQVYRTVLQPASYHAAVTAAVTAANPNLKVVSPITMAYLARIALGGNNNDRLTYISDTVPRTMRAGSSYNVEFVVRNNGWNNLDMTSADPSARVVLTWDLGPGTTVITSSDIAPGAVALINGTVVAPATPGSYLMAWQLRRGTDDTGDFDNLGNPAVFAAIDVEQQ